MELWLRRRVLVLGSGITGQEVAKVLAAGGAEVLVSDAGPVSEADSAALARIGVEVESGGHERAKKELSSFDFVVPSPGIAPSRPILAHVLSEGAEVVSELDLGMQLVDGAKRGTGRTPPAVVAVTGTNGKTTVCRLAAEIGRQEGMDVHACGNLEMKFATAAATYREADVFVVEASSFALVFARTFHPRVAVVTNLAPDHLDWHESFESYRAAKARIAARQSPGDLFLYPAGQPELAGLAPADGPLREAFDGASLEATDAPWLGRAAHFADDAAAAARSMIFLGVGDGAVRRAVAGFDLDPHRLDLVGEKGDVAFHDDSVSANPHATIAALSSFDRPVVLIAGGRKKVDLSPLAAQAGRLRSVVAIGEAAGDIAEVFEPTGVIVSKAASMDEAVGMAFGNARPGDAVLLSPACASWDMFAGYAERGRAFRDACRRLGVT